MTKNHKPSVVALGRELLRSAAAFVPPPLRQAPAYWRWRRFLRAAQAWDPAKVQAWQLERLRAVVKAACERTEGYRELYRRAGIGPEDIRALSDIKHLPLISKPLLRENLEAFSVKTRGGLKVSSHGSTGTPFSYYIGREQLAIEYGCMHEAWSRTGWKLGAPSVILRGSRDSPQDSTCRYDAFARALRISIAHLSKEALPRYLEAIRKYRCRVVQAFPAALTWFADLLVQTGRVGEVEFDILLLGSENIYAWQIQKFERVFPGAKMMSWYGHSEMAIQAPWCPRSRAFHPWAFYGYTEVVTPDGAEAEPGEEGELVGTSWHNFHTPFIRYRTQDYATKGATPCSNCGADSVTLDQINGRSFEVLVTRQGALISMTLINTMHDDVFESISRFQFCQTQPGKALFRYVSAQELAPERVAFIKRSLELKLGSNFIIQPQRVPSIEAAPSGKHLVIRQFLDIDRACAREDPGIG